jgi:hypothetical protein
VESGKLAKQLQQIASLLFVQPISVGELVHPEHLAKSVCLKALSLEMVTHLDPSKILRGGNEFCGNWFHSYARKMSAEAPGALGYANVRKLVTQARRDSLTRMSKTDLENVQRRKSMTRRERLAQFQQTHEVAMSTIASEAEVRRKKSDILRAAREAATKAASASD